MPLAPQRNSRIMRAFKIRSKAVSLPEELAVTLASVKAYLRITGSAADALLTELIKQATSLVELNTNRVLINTDFVGYADKKEVWSFWWPGVLEAPVASMFQSPALFEIPGMPMSAFSTLTYVTIDGTEIEADSDDYIVDLSSYDMYGRIALKYFATTAPSGQEINAYKFEWTSGYGDSSADVPSAIAAAITRVVAYMYENRGDCGCSGDELLKASGAYSFVSVMQGMRI